MKTTLPSILSLCVLCISASALRANEKQSIPNRLIDYKGFVTNASALEPEREKRRVTEDQFLAMASDPATIIFDARSAEKYKMLHIKGARNLNLSDITETELQKVIPDKTTRILIYCNNNFENEQVALASKVAKASLNIYTFNVLHSYGYTNVYELGPLLDIHTTKLPFEGTRAKK